MGPSKMEVVTWCNGVFSSLSRIGRIGTEMATGYLFLKKQACLCVGESFFTEAYVGGV